MDKKKVALIVAIVLILVSVAYGAGKKFGKSKSVGEFVQLEDGRKVELKNIQNRSGEHRGAGMQADAMGKIKSIGATSMVIEQFEIPTGERHGNWNGQSGQGATDQNNQAAPTDSNIKTRQPMTPTIIGDLTINFNDQTVFSKIQRGMGRPGSGGAESTPEDITRNDLAEGDVISVWYLTEKSAEGNQIASKILVRKN